MLLLINLNSNLCLHVWTVGMSKSKSTQAQREYANSTQKVQSRNSLVVSYDEHAAKFTLFITLDVKIRNCICFGVQKVAPCNEMLRKTLEICCL